MYGVCNSCTFNVYVSREFYLWPLFASPWVRVSCGGPRGASPWVRMAFGWALWLRTDLLEPNLPEVTVRGCWVGSGASRACWGCRVGRCRVFRGPVRFAALANVWMRNDMFIFCILSCLIISIPREFTIYVCLIISLPRGFTIFVVLRHPCTYWHCIFLHYLWSYTSLGLMLFVVKTTWNKAYSILFYSIFYSILFYSILNMAKLRSCHYCLGLYENWIISTMKFGPNLNPSRPFSNFQLQK